MDWPATLTGIAAIIAALTGLITAIGVLVMNMKQNAVAKTIDANALVSSKQKEEVKNTILQKVEDVKQEVKDTKNKIGDVQVTIVPPVQNEKTSD